MNYNTIRCLNCGTTIQDFVGLGSCPQCSAALKCWLCLEPFQAGEARVIIRVDGDPRETHGDCAGDVREVHPPGPDDLVSRAKESLTDSLAHHVLETLKEMGLEAWPVNVGQAKEPVDIPAVERVEEGEEPVVLPPAIASFLEELLGGGGGLVGV